MHGVNGHLDDARDKLRSIQTCGSPCTYKFPRNTCATIFTIYNAARLVKPAHIIYYETGLTYFKRAGYPALCFA